MSSSRAPEPFVLVTAYWFRSGWTGGTLDEAWDQVMWSIEINAAFGPESLIGLGSFSHVEIVFLFHRVAECAIGALGAASARPGRMVGIFAQRARGRPNRIGVTACGLLGVSDALAKGTGLGAISGTPVLDLKSCMRGFLPRAEVKGPAWAAERMQGYGSPGGRHG